MRLKYSMLSLALICAPCFGETSIPQQEFAALGDLSLVSGETLRHTTIGYMTAGTLRADRSNVIVMPSWFIGTAKNLFEAGKIGPGKIADTDRYFVIAVDALGNGVSTSPSNSVTQGGADFPAIMIDDMVNAAQLLVTRHLGIDHVHAVMGISMGGMQTLQWIAQYPDFMDKAVAIDASPRMTTWDLAQWRVHENALQMARKAGVSDQETMAFLIKIFMLTLWTPDYWVQKVQLGTLAEFEAGFQQGFAELDPDDYLVQLRAMMGHDAYADFASSGDTYTERIQSDLLLIGVPGDHTVNQSPARALAQEIGALYVGIESNCGHLGTTCEASRVSAIVNSFLNESP
ncbi:MAG: alpha/beta fold hydrolase [Saprospiraceae bacterium]|nr:alpha/beta fold hydrolase [Saprospiraceae bacterium]